MNVIELSIVIPMYNEAARIGTTLDQVITFLNTGPYASEVIVVDDGSADQSVLIAQEKLPKVNHQILKNPVNRGKGNAVKQGMLAAKGDYVLFTDADLSTPIAEVSGFIQNLKNGYDVVIGSRALRDSNVEIHQPFWREWMGKTFNLFARFLTFRNIHDSQCGFKCFKREVAQDLFKRQKLDGFSFDVEIVYLAQRLGYRILEAPVTWRNSPQSRVRVFTDPLWMFLDLIRIRRIHRFK